MNAQTNPAAGATPAGPAMPYPAPRLTGPSPERQHPGVAGPSESGVLERAVGRWFMWMVPT